MVMPMMVRVVLSFRREKLAHPVWPGPFGIVVVCREHRLTDELGLALRLVARAQGVIEDGYAGSPGSVLDQLFDLRIVHRSQLLGVEEIPNIGFVLDEYKTLLFQ